MSRNYSSTIVAVIVVLFKFSGIRNGMFFDGWLAYGKIPISGSKQCTVLSETINVSISHI